MTPSIQIICQKSIQLGEAVTPRGLGQHRANPFTRDVQLLAEAWSEMAIKNILADMYRQVREIRVASIRAGETAVVPALRRSKTVFCGELMSLIDAELKQHSPSRQRYTKVVCLGYKIRLPGAAYEGKTDDADDMKAKCKDLKEAIKAARSLVDREGRKFNDHTNMLKVFVAPEFYFRGRNGAYDHSVVHGTAPKSGILGRFAKQEGIAEIMLQEIKQPCYKDWLFVLGTAIAATKFTETVCAQLGCTGKIVFNQTGNKTVPQCSVNRAHKTREKVNGALVENVGLIFKEGTFHTVSKELVSGIDYVDDKVKLRAQELKVVANNEASGYKSGTDRVPKFQDERMGGCIFTIDGVTIGVEICLDHAATTGSSDKGRLEHAGNIQLQLVPSFGMSITNFRATTGGVIFNVDGSTPHVEVIGGEKMIVQSTKYDGWSFTPTDRGAIDWSGTDLEKLKELETKHNRGQWTNSGINALSTGGKCQGSVVMYGPYALPRV